MARPKLNLETRTVRLYKGDTKALQTHIPNIPYNAVIRELIHKYVQGLESGNIKPIRFDPAKLEFTETETSDD